MRACFDSDDLSGWPDHACQHRGHHTLMRADVKDASAGAVPGR
jgi:hypothetical protein